MKQLYLVCNAHIDPVWLWDLEEGISAALSTFRAAADFCEEFDGFVFNHNEALLYQWVEEYEPPLFARIKRLVQEGKWHIMGGWYLQPDCNMPSGESFVRQIQSGREYFEAKFGVRPTTAINFDPFGHSRGLVQIMKKAGYDSYLFCRPSQEDCPLPDEDFIWVGFDGSRLMAHRAGESYNSLMGEAAKKVRERLNRYQAEKEEKKQLLLLWGVGNHGGGPSREDLRNLSSLKAREKEWNLLHSSPEQYFSTLNANMLKEVHKDLNAWAIGCYTSQIRIKQKHRALESELSAAEKMVSAAALYGLIPYPEAERAEAERALMTAEFHDILPGSSIARVEEQGIRMLESGRQLAQRLRRRAFFALLSGEKKADEGEYPICVYNPHPYPVSGIFDCEFQLKNQNWSDLYALPVLYQNGKQLPLQVEKEDCNMNLDWRKKLVFQTTFPPSSMTRLSCMVSFVEKKPVSDRTLDGRFFEFQNNRLAILLDRENGRIASWKVDGKEYLKPGAFRLVVMQSDKDPWGMRLNGYDHEIGEFTLLTPEESGEYSGCGHPLDAVRVIEDGEVRTVVEAVYGYGNSRACMRFYFPADSDSVELEVVVNWEEKGKLLKLEIPTQLHRAQALGENAYGVMEYDQDRKEKVSQRWNGLFDKERDMAFSCINDSTYGIDFYEGTMRLSLLHSAAYSAHPIGDRQLFVDDRLLAYIDQGEHPYHFCLRGGSAHKIRREIGADAVIFHEKPVVTQVFPAGEGRKPEEVCRLSDCAVVLSAMRQLADGRYLLRLFETTGEAREITLELPFAGLKKQVFMQAYEIKTMCLSADNGELTETTLLGE